MFKKKKMEHMKPANKNPGCCYKNGNIIMNIPVITVDLSECVVTIIDSAVHILIACFVNDHIRSSIGTVLAEALHIDPVKIGRK